MAGIFGGRNKKAVFVKKGEPPPIEQQEEQQEVQQEEQQEEHQEVQQEVQQEEQQEVQHRYIYFPLEIISTVCYYPHQISIQK